MKYAVISDIHSNTIALEAVVKDAEKQRIDRFLCLGDVVGYGPNPRKAIRLVDRLTEPEDRIQGNHDYFCSNNEIMENYTKEAIITIEITRNMLRKRDKKFLKPKFDTLLTI